VRPGESRRLNFFFYEFVGLPEVFFPQDAVTDRAELRSYPAEETRLMFLQPEAQDLFHLAFHHALRKRRSSYGLLG
jgi:hypothetical protein